MSRRTTVLFIWDADERLKYHLNKSLMNISGINLIFPSEISQENLVKLAKNAEIVVGWRPTKELLFAAENLRLFINPGAGIQHLIHLFRELSSSRKIILANCHGNSFFVAQHTVALLLALTNKIVLHHNWMVAGKWNIARARLGIEDAKSLPLRDRKIGLLGYGAVNQKVHKLLSGFDLKYSILRRDWEKQSIQLHSRVKKYCYPELQQFLEEIDTLIIGVPLTSLTKNLIRMRELELLGSEGLLVNVARGPVVNEEDLFTALKREAIAGAAIDVWYNYSPSSDSRGRKYPFSFPFHNLRNVILSPHRAASPLDDIQRWDEVIENIRRFANGTETFINVVDLEKEY